MNDIHVIVVGGGMVGAAIALGLLRQGKRVSLLEQSGAPQPPDLLAPPDLRISALGLQSQLFLHEIGAWQYIENLRLCAYNILSVSDAPLKNLPKLIGTFCEKLHSTNFDAASIGERELGFMVENPITCFGIWQALQTYGEQLKIYTNCSAINFLQNQNNIVCAEFMAADCAYKLQADLLVAADGANSATRSLAGIEINIYNYKQSAMIIGVELAAPAGNRTWQQFKASGPVALLPSVTIGDKHYATLIWYDAAAKITSLGELDNASLLLKAREHFPATTGEIVAVYNHAGFKLARRHARNYSQGRVVLAGDSAHTINPLAGQGVNLGFQDAQLLLQLIDNLGADIKNNAALSACLQTYEHKRRPQNALMMHTMDLFYHAFSNDNCALKLARNAALGLAERSGVLKQKVLRHALGFA